jgi:hypothetical protein
LQYYQGECPNWKWLRTVDDLPHRQTLLSLNGHHHPHPHHRSGVGSGLEEGRIRHHHLKDDDRESSRHDVRAEMISTAGAAAAAMAVATGAATAMTVPHPLTN